MNHDEVEREILLGMSLGQLLVVVHGSPRTKAADQTDAAPLIHKVSLTTLFSS